jgi:hypothetical protein
VTVWLDSTVTHPTGAQADQQRSASSWAAACSSRAQPRDTIIPRLIAADADLTHVHPVRSEAHPAWPQVLNGAHEDVPGLTEIRAGQAASAYFTREPTSEDACPRFVAVGVVPLGVGVMAALAAAAVSRPA